MSSAVGSAVGSAGVAGVAGVAGCWATVLARRPLYPPPQWSRGLGNLAPKNTTLAYGAPNTHFWSLELPVLVSSAVGSAGVAGSATCRAAHDDNIGLRTPTHTLLVPRTSTARELCCGLCWRCWLYLPLGNCPGETAVGPPRTMVARTGHKSYELTAGSACSTGSATCRWATVLVRRPLDHPAQWSRGPGNLELLACG